MDKKVTHLGELTIEGHWVLIEGDKEEKHLVWHKVEGGNVCEHRAANHAYGWHLSVYKG